MKKLYGEQRRSILLETLKTSGSPITGAELAAKAGVSRQVIVSDMTLLKAKGEPILATSQGYLYFSEQKESSQVSRSIACRHSPDETERELLLLVGEGVTVKDVSVEHPVYGELTAGVHVSSAREVEAFMERIRTTGATYLLELTDGTHLHTITADSEAALDAAEEVLRVNGLLLKGDE